MTAKKESPKAAAGKAADKVKADARLDKDDEAVADLEAAESELAKAQAVDDPELEIKPEGTDAESAAKSREESREAYEAEVERREGAQAGVGEVESARRVAAAKLKSDEEERLEQQRKDAESGKYDQIEAAAEQNAEEKLPQVEAALAQANAGARVRLMPEEDPTPPLAQFRVSFYPSKVAVVVDAISEDRAVHAARGELRTIAEGNAVAEPVS